uniref:Uncharacterized protein n=1 Tax=Anopheles merus TaxID=30066 RepID=A0A182USY6_ANOME
MLCAVRNRAVVKVLPGLPLSYRHSQHQDTTGSKNAACECANLKQQIQNKPAHSSCPPQLSPLLQQSTIRTLVVAAAGTSRLLGQAGPEGQHCCGSLGGASIECTVGKRDCSLLRVAIFAPDVPLGCNSIAMANATVLPPTATDCSTEPALHRTKGPALQLPNVENGRERNFVLQRNSTRRTRSHLSPEPLNLRASWDDTATFLPVCGGGSAVTVDNLPSGRDDPSAKKAKVHTFFEWYGPGTGELKN